MKQTRMMWKDTCIVRECASAGIAAVFGAVLWLMGGVALAGTYTAAGLYQIKTPDDWLVAPRTDTQASMDETNKLIEKSKLELWVDLKEVSLPLVISKHTNLDAKEVRVMVGPPEITTEQFNALSVADLKLLSKALVERQLQAMKVGGFKVLATESDITTFKGVSAIRTTHQYIDNQGMRASRAQYLIYRGSATLIVGMEHIVQRGEPNYKAVESQLLDFKILAK